MSSTELIAEPDQSERLAPPTPAPAPGVRATVPATIGLTAVSVITAASFSRIYAGWGFLGPLLTLTVLVHGAALALRALRVNGWIAVPLTYLLALVLVARHEHANTLIGGWIPWTDTLSAVRADLDQVWRQFPTALIPVPSTGAFGLISGLAMGLVAATSDLFAFRADGRAEALAPAAVVYIALSAVGDERNSILLTALWLGAAFLAVALLRSLHLEADPSRVGRFGPGVTLRRAGGAAALALVAVVAAAVAAPHLPGAGAEPLLDAKKDGSEVTEVLSPLVDIRGRLVEFSEKTMFEVTASRAAYWRLTSLARFDGQTWDLPDDALEPAASALAAPVDPFDVQIAQSFEIDALGGSLAPAAFEPQAVEGERLYYVEGSDTLVVPGRRGLENGMRYRVRSALRSPSPATLSVATALAPPDPIYLALPNDFPDELRRTASDIVAGSDGSAYGQALALQNWFQSTFTYDLQVPRGHSEDAIADFLSRRRGYCEQFAGTYAAFARAVGLPARVAVGFTPGFRTLSGAYEVRGRNAHAWPEVWFDGIGWVAFEPTPGRGAPDAAYTGLAPAQDGGSGQQGGGGSGGSSAPTTTVSTSATPTTAPIEGPTGSIVTSVPPVLPGTTDGSDGGGIPVAGLVVGLLALLGLWAVLMPPVVGAFVRWRRRTPTAKVVGAWRSSAQALGLVGAPLRPGDTPLEHANRAARATGFDPVTLRELARDATFAVYGTQPVTAGMATRAERLRRYVVANAREITPLGERVRARLDPRVAARLA